MRLLYASQSSFGGIKNYVSKSASVASADYNSKVKYVQCVEDGMYYCDRNFNHYSMVHELKNLAEGTFLSETLISEECCIL